ncbi:alpha/beta family hydrolase [Mesobacterium sp. TK19101]|uniref:Alpha/beta family hydrolase n=1 Tax=Mesobacterium hydrothermale TaxID=3111907 RepID=A0ABU6HED5_9RHOB|nr:alpha/beta family hydrolase [Mesobacterium sp. TK19101]MEC3860812.1 alpha/beta family hydrolase [Mesobacterium sp. TK19101]
MVDLLLNGEEPGRPTVLLAHGSGAPMDTPWMTAVAEGLALRGFRVARFEFAYMAARRNGGSRRPPGAAETMVPEYMTAINALACDGPLIIGGKSMGGRIASMIADDLYASGRILGLMCLGFPFHPQNKPDALRLQHLPSMKCPTLICQGTRDPLGTRAEVETLTLSPEVQVHWLEDGDHDLKPRKRVTGCSLEDHLDQACSLVANWGRGLI